MNEETRKMIETLAEKLGTTAAHLWEILIRQATVSFWTDLLFYALTAIAIVVAIRLSLAAYRKGQQSDYDDLEWKLFVAAPLMLTTVILVVISLCSIEGTITKKLNPEFWALQQIVQGVKK